MKRILLAVLMLSSSLTYTYSQIRPDGLGGWNVFSPNSPITQIRPDGLGGFNIW